MFRFDHPTNSVEGSPFRSKPQPDGRTDSASLRYRLFMDSYARSAGIPNGTTSLTCWERVVGDAALTTALTLFSRARKRRKVFAARPDE